MLDKLIGEYGHGYGNGYGHKDHRSSGYGFEEHKKYESHMESEGGYFDRQARYDHRVRLPVNHGRPPMAHMPPCDEEDSDSDVEEFYKSSRSHHTTVLPDHGKIHRQQPTHMNFMPPPPMSQPHHNGRHEDAYLGGHGMQHHGAHGMQHHGEHGMQHHGEHGMKHHGAHGMKHQDRLMAPQVLPHHVYMNPNSGGGHHKAGWGNKGL